jgi:electron transfer flavoprotein beta subunit
VAAVSEPAKAESVSILRQAIACGANDAVLLTDSAFAGSDTAATSRILAEAVKLLGDYDLIFCGRRSTDGETGQVGPELAARLNRACCVSCTKLEAEENVIRCQCLTDLGTARYEMALPAVVTFCNGINSPRLQSLSGLFKANRKEIPKINRETLGLPRELCGQAGSPTMVKKTYRRPFAKRRPQHLTDPEEIFQALQAGKEASHG